MEAVPGFVLVRAKKHASWTGSWAKRVENGERADMNSGRAVLILLSLISLLILSACEIERYGDAAVYPRDARPDIHVIVPENAPYISQQFHIAAGEEAARHNGMDIWAKLGTPVLAAAGGRVVRSYFEPMYGNRVVIDHGEDEGGLPMATSYMHLDQRQVTDGQVVVRGQQIGTLGDTGVLSALVHLHFEVWRQGSQGSEPLDPQLLWMNGVGRVTCFEADTDYPIMPFRITYPVICK